METKIRWVRKSEEEIVEIKRKARKQSFNPYPFFLLLLGFQVLFYVLVGVGGFNTMEPLHPRIKGGFTLDNFYFALKYSLVMSLAFYFLQIYIGLRKGVYINSKNPNDNLYICSVCLSEKCHVPPKDCPGKLEPIRYYDEVSVAV